MVAEVTKTGPCEQRAGNLHGPEVCPQCKNGSQVLLPFLPTKRRCFVSPLLNIHILNRPIQLTGRIPCLDRQDLGAWIGRDFLIERGAG